MAVHERVAKVDPVAVFGGRQLRVELGYTLLGGLPGLH
jgi:hypothetical protein